MEEVMKKQVSEVKKIEKKKEKQALIKKKKEKLQMTDAAKRKNYLKQIGQFLDSPFQHDQMFAIYFIASECRDNMKNQDDVIGMLFYDRIFNRIMKDPFDRDWDKIDLMETI